MSVSFPLKSWISFLEADYAEPDHSQFLQIVICLSPQPVAKFYALSRYIQIDKLVERKQLISSITTLVDYRVSPQKAKATFSN